MITNNYKEDELAEYPCCDYHVEDANWSVHCKFYYNDVIMGAISSQITSLTIVYSTVYSDADQ